MNLEGIYLVIALMHTFWFECQGYKVLVLFPVPARSHARFGDGFVRHLLKAGHEVTYITPFPVKSVDPNLRQISVADNSKVVRGAIKLASLMNQEMTLDYGSFLRLTRNVAENTVRNPDVKKLVNDPAEHFDVVLVEWIFSDFFSGFAAVFDCPFIWVFPYEPNYVGLSLIDEATNPAYTANVQFNEIPPFNFLQRAFALWFQIMYKIEYMLFYESHENSLYESTFGPIVAKRGRTLTPFREFKHNASLMFGCSHVSFGQAIRLPQNYVSIAGHYIDDVQPLPEDLQSLMDNAKYGVVYFSLGSNLKSKDFPDVVKENLLKVFSGMKQTVIWKFEEELLNRPKNVHILKWAPQISILAHPNCVLFITHGGLLSTIEAVHFGIPFIGIPAFYDQYFNVNQAVKKGIGLKVGLTENIVNDLKEAIHEMMDNPKYRHRMKEVSFAYHHRPVSPGKEIQHWVEHVVKTGGAPHLRSPALLIPWYQKMFLDVLGLIFALLFITVYLIKLFRKQKQLPSNKRKMS